jgi:asparagine synthetase B (glutamine-hydrolysing)
MIVADLELPAYAPPHTPRPKSDLQKRFVLNEARLTMPQTTRHAVQHPPVIAPVQKPLDEVCAALVLGTRDYVRKNGFKQVLLGLSGGIDSAVTAVIAVRALGAENVIGVLMPSRFTISASNEDAEELARNLQIRTLTLPIEEPVLAFENVLAAAFKNTARDITEENLQARVRGILLMALSNKFGGSCFRRAIKASPRSVIARSTAIWSADLPY